MTSTLMHPKGYPLATCKNPLILTAIAKAKPKGLKLTVVANDSDRFRDSGAGNARCDAENPITFEEE